MQSATAAGQLKRTRSHDEMHTDTGGGNDDDFILFQSRYAKRVCRQQRQKTTNEALLVSSQPLAGPSQRRPQLQNDPSSDQGGSKFHSSQPTSSGAVGKKPRSNQYQHRTSGKSTSTSSASRSQLYEEVIDSVVSQPSNDEVVLLKGLVHDLQCQVLDLKHQIDFLSSCMGLTEPVHEASTQLDCPVSYAAVVSRQPELSAPIRTAIVSAVHSDLQLQQSRRCNVVITGLPSNPDLIDGELFIAVCSNELGVQPEVVKVKRLGSPVPDKIQPLLVVLRTAEQASQLLACARDLRRSDDAYTSRSIYISAHLTRAERQAAYESRCRRCQHKASVTDRRPHQPNVRRDTASCHTSTTATVAEASTVGPLSPVSPNASDPSRLAAAPTSVSVDAPPDDVIVDLFASPMSVDNNGPSSKLRFIAPSFAPRPSPADDSATVSAADESNSK